jgi:hypothetical protein
LENERNGYRYSGHNFRKFYTVTDTATGEQFVALCSALDKSIYKRLRELMEADIKANRSIIGTLPTRKDEEASINQATDLEMDPKQETQSKISGDDILSLIPLPAEKSKTDKTKNPQSKESDDDFWSGFED